MSEIEFNESVFTDVNHHFLIGEVRGLSPDRPPGNLRAVIEQSLEAWRCNPLARRIVALTTQFVIGKGVKIRADDPKTHDFLSEFWNHPLNRMAERVHEWSDELCRTGNLFILLSSDVSGMTYARAVPSAQVEEIISHANDIEQSSAFRVLFPSGGNQIERSSFVPTAENVSAATLNLPSLDRQMLHFTVNRPVGGQWGEPDLAPVLFWLRMYSDWLYERARLNVYRNSFLFVVKSQTAGETQRRELQAKLNTFRPAPGSILVSGRDEEWTVLSPNLESADANTDGLAIKKMIAAGMGIPIHFLAEQEIQSGIMAEAAGGPTFRLYEQRQRLFLGMLTELLRHVLMRRTIIDRQINADAEIYIQGDDISAADNRMLSEAAEKSGALMLSLYDRGLVSAEQVTSVVARFMGEEL